jgi:hypothetical protein
MKKSILTNHQDKLKVEAECWLKANHEWHYPNNKRTLDVEEYDVIELLYESYYGDLFYCYNNENKHNGRLYRGKWNN